MMATIMMAMQRAAARRNFGTKSRPIAPTISKMPVMNTSNNGAGNTGGMMLAVVVIARKKWSRIRRK